MLTTEDNFTRPPSHEHEHDEQSERFSNRLCRNGELSSFRQLDDSYRLPNHNDVEYKDLQMISDWSRLHLNQPS